ncbi:hypothetical protein KV34_13340 [Klebsiella aerogenes]|nr:hypothetical protein KV34_13340 [Klebsiella aerogenes]
MVRELTVQFIQMKSSQQRAQGGTPADASPGRVKVTAILHAVMQELPQQVKQDRMADVTGELVIQPSLIDGGIIALNVGAEHKRCVVPAQVVMHFQGALPASAMAFYVFTQRMYGQNGRKGACQHF